MINQLLFRIFASSATVICPGDTKDTCATGLPNIAAGSSELHTALQVLFGILAAIAVLMIVIGGFRFVLSEGKPENVSKARETIIYSLVGLVIALLAEAIVSFALGKLG